MSIWGSFAQFIFSSEGGGKCAVACYRATVRTGKARSVLLIWERGSVGELIWFDSLLPLSVHSQVFLALLQCLASTLVSYCSFLN